MGWGGIIAGGAAGLGKAAGDIAQGYIDKENKADLAKMLSDIDEQRSMRIAQAQEAMRQQGRQADFEADMTNAPRKTAAEVDRTRAVGVAETDVLTAREKDRERVRTEAEIAETNNPQWLAGQRKKAEAGVTSVQRAQATAAVQNARAAGIELDIKQLALEDAKRVAALTKQYGEVIANDDLTPEAKATKLASIRRQLDVIRTKGEEKSTEMDTEKVVTEVTNPDGSTTKTERVQRRKPGVGGASTGNDPLDMRPRDPGAKPDEKPAAASAARGPAVAPEALANIDKAAKRAGYVAREGKDGQRYYQKGGSGPLVRMADMEELLGLTGSDDAPQFNWQ